MTRAKSFRPVLDKLRAAGLRPTRQRMALARLLFDGDVHHHITAEALHSRAVDADVKVSLATVYNTLHQFTESGLLREVTVDSNRSYFDTNTADHHHFYYEQSCRLIDIPLENLDIQGIPANPDGLPVRTVDVVVRVAA